MGYSVTVIVADADRAALSAVEPAVPTILELTAAGRRQRRQLVTISRLATGPSPGEHGARVGAGHHHAGARLVQVCLGRMVTRVWVHATGLFALAGVLSVLVGCAGPGPSREAPADQPSAGQPSAELPTTGSRCGPLDADPAAAACRITAGEAVLRDPRSAPRALADAGSATERAYRLLATRPQWDGAVLGALDARLRGHVRHAVAAQRELTALAGRPRDTVPAWRIEDPLPAPRLRALYDDAQRRFGVSWTVLAAIHLVETRMGRVDGVSSAGAQGPMQFMPTTWARYGLGGDVDSPRDAILGAANYLAANGARDLATLDRALRRYNNDVRYVRAVRHYAAMMADDPAAYVGLYSWPVRYRTTAGDLLLPVGYVQQRPIPVQQWLATRPR